MKTREQVRLELIGLHYSAMTERINAAVLAGTQTAELAAAYQNRLLKARALAQAEGSVQRRDDGAYLVTSQTDPRTVYQVNGSCTCPDYARADKGWCKHRLAAYLTYMACTDVDRRRARQYGLALPHDHTYRCGHGPDVVQCWDKDCTDIVAPLCETCTQPPREGDPVTRRCELCAKDIDPTLDHICTPTPPPMPEEPTFEELLAALDEPGARTATSCPPLRAEQYEPAPVLTPQAPPMPEAPASLNLTLNLPGSHKLMYTMRSGLTGEAGDVELAERLTRLWPKLEAAIQPAPETPEAGWLHRISQACLPLSWRGRNGGNGHSGSEQ